MLLNLSRALLNIFSFFSMTYSGAKHECRRPQSHDIRPDSHARAAPAGAQPASLRISPSPACAFPAAGDAACVGAGSALHHQRGRLRLVGPLALAPAFVELVTRLRSAGSSPLRERRLRADQAHQQRAFRAHRGAAPDLQRHLSLRGKSRTGTFGDGYVGGFLGRFKAMPDAEFDTLAALNAFALAGQASMWRSAHRGHEHG